MSGYDHINRDYAIVVRYTPKPWDREDRSTSTVSYHPEFGLFPRQLWDDDLNAKINELNAETDAKHAEHEAERARTQDWGMCPAHGEDSYYELDDDCTCYHPEQDLSWAQRSGHVYHDVHWLTDDEAMYWMEIGAKVVGE